MARREEEASDPSRATDAYSTGRSMRAGLSVIYCSPIKLEMEDEERACCLNGSDLAAPPPETQTTGQHNR